MRADSPQLFSRVYGEPGLHPLIILHGLFGSSKNWQSVATLLSENYQVYALDLRNHGESFHSASHSIADMVEDVLRFIEFQQVVEPVLIGHSMGGLVGMQLALENPGRLSSLVVVDIAPRSYDTDYSNEFNALSLDLALYQTRAEIDKAMQKYISSKELRQFLQMNIDQNEKGYFYKINAEVIESQPGRTTFMPSINTLAIYGSESGFILDSDKDLFKKYFEQVQFACIQGAAHWLHYSHQGAFLKAVSEFLK